MLSIIFALLSCIPKEDPPEVVLNLHLEKKLPEILNENSGMTVDQDIFWFINDSGNDSVLYGYNQSTNEVTRQIAVRGSVNTDWEALTQNNEYLFIGDFGNNASGNRTNLRIYMISKSQLHAATDTVLHSGIIYFNYEDQTDFSPSPENSTKFDCEAFIATNEMIIIFAKDWENSQTRLYKLPIQPGNHTADLQDEWNVNGLITDACLSGDNKLYLVGYNLAPFLWVYSDFNTETMGFSQRERTDFSFLGIQTEGIWVTGDGVIYISSEKSSYTNSAASLFTVRETAN